MIMTDLREVADAVVRRAQRKGFILPSEIREELAHTNLPETQLEEVIALSRPSLRFHQGRYYFKTKLSPRVRQEKRQQRAVHQVIRQLVRQYKKKNAQTERRQQGRADFIQPVKVRTEDKREFTLLSRDLSESGIRLIGTRGLLGQKVQVDVPHPDGKEHSSFLVRVIWTCAIGDGLFENGGTFLEMAPGEPAPLKIAGDS
ncbi:MAG TPA: PilZ domain-containing protein [Gemmataceae bacterium]|nr:PilZ domain-containing protein [Gemmataceae bacterium]